MRRCVVSWLAVVGALAAADPLVVDGGFEAASADRSPGWSALWTRAAGAGEARYDGPAHAGARALVVVHRGTGDWSVGQAGGVAVVPGDLYRVGAWLRADAVADAEVGVVERRADGTVIDWIAGAARTTGTHDWRRVERRFVVPPGCASVQVRVTGDGPGTLTVDDVDLVRLGSLAELTAGARDAAIPLANDALTLTVRGDGTLAAALRDGGRSWTQVVADPGIVVTAATAVDARTARLALRDVRDDLDLVATVALDPTRPEISLAITGEGAVGEPIAWPHPFATSAGDRLIVPLNEGVQYPVDDAAVPAMDLVAYGGHGICMPWWGQCDATGAGVLAIIGTPDDARLTLDRGARGAALRGAPRWDASRGAWRYERRITYSFFARGGHVAFAKRYREHARDAGLVRTLAEKRAVNPAVDRLLGAVDLWNWDLDKVALCRELKDAGVEHVLWSAGGDAAEVRAIDDLGYLVGRYDIFQDVWPPGTPGMATAGWPDDLVRLPDGEWMRGWEHQVARPDGGVDRYPGGVVSSPRQLDRARERIPAELKTIPYRCRFIDTTTASPWREDYAPAHPLTRSDDRRWKLALLEYCSRDLRLVLGSETGLDAAAPYVHYFEGMLSLGPYRLPDSGYQMMAYRAPTPDFLKYQVGHGYRLPLFELVYHDCVVATWYWGDGTNKTPEVWRRRDLYNLLYATPPLVMFDRARWATERERIIATCREVGAVARRLATDEMTDHAFITADGAVQATTWSSGARVLVNFGDAPATLEDGSVVAPLGWRIEPP